MIDYSSWSLICWVNGCRSSGGREEKQWDVHGADFKVRAEDNAFYEVSTLPRKKYYTRNAFFKG